MAKTKTAPVTDEVEVEATEEDEVEETEAEAAMTPKTLAEELEISPKSLRTYLRREFPRDSKDKNTSWRLTDDQVEKARAHFSESDEDDETEGDEDEA